MRSENELPVDAVLPALRDALAAGSSAVLVAPPGAGKSTRVPLALAREPWAAGGRILVLAPRRLAARAAAGRMAATLGEAVGETVGYRVRLESRVGPRTRIEVITEGVFTRMILDDPELAGTAAVLFDEYHERSLDADLGLALALDAQAALRPDLRLLPMSATLDGAAVARLLGDAPLIESAGRMFPVETRYLGREPGPYTEGRRIEDRMADAVLRALAAGGGGILAFLPGAGEIERTAERLAERLRDPSVDIARLYGALDPAEQDRAVAPAPAGRRKVVLASAIAETSLTIDGIGTVIDSGLARVPRYDPARGLTRLETVRVSRAAADQRRGRAGRLGPGRCWRLWDEQETRALQAFAEPEMLNADLAPLALALAEWGVAEPGDLAWLDPPPAGAFAEAQALLTGLGALDRAGRITAEGKALMRLPLPPRLGHMVRAAAARGEGALAARIAAVLSEPGLGGRDPDLRHRLEAAWRDRGPRARAMRGQAERWARAAGADPAGPVDTARAGAVLALAFPDRIARARRGGDGSYALAGGGAAGLEPTDALAREPWLAVGEVTGAARQGRILLAAPLGETDVAALAAGADSEDEIRFDPATKSVRARRLRRLGRIALGEEALPDPDPEAVRQALVEGIRGLGLGALPWTAGLTQWRARVAFLRVAEGDRWPELGDAALAATLDDWLGPYVAGRRRLDDIGPDLLGTALRGLLPGDLARRVDDGAPSHVTAPSGARLPIDYDDPAGPSVSGRVQQFFGLDRHPTIGGGRVPLAVKLLSPAGRPVQVTRDLPGFWRGTWRDVRADLRGRYPKHAWPEDPLTAAPTDRAKSAGPRR